MNGYGYLHAENLSIGETLYTEMRNCDECGFHFRLNELRQSKTIGGHYCPACWVKLETEHRRHRDWEGEKFE